MVYPPQRLTYFIWDITVSYGSSMMRAAPCAESTGGDAQVFLFVRQLMDLYKIAAGIIENSRDGCSHVGWLTRELNAQ